MKALTKALKWLREIQKERDVSLQVSEVEKALKYLQANTRVRNISIGRFVTERQAKKLSDAGVRTIAELAAQDIRKTRKLFRTRVRACPEILTLLHPEK